MFRRLMNMIFRRRSWHEASFDEVAELYMSRLMTVLAVNLVSLFMAVYLLKLGYSVGFIAVFYGMLYVIKLPLSLLFAKYVAYYGPKHGVLVANILRIPSLVAMAFVHEHGLSALVVFGLFQAASAGMYALSYGVDFSKVRNPVHTGKELSGMQMIEQGAKVLAPVTGGVLATFLGPEVVIIVASLLMILAAVPLFRTVEPTVLKSRVVLEAFPWRLTGRSFVAATGVGYDFVTSGLAWSLFAAAIVFAGLGEGVYASLGALASVGVLVSVFAAWFFGRIVDRRQGDILFTTGVIGNTIIHLFRAFVSTPASVLGVNMTNETATAAYVLPWTRATFDLADQSGHRVAYFMFIGMFENLGAAMACFTLAGLVWVFGLTLGLQLFFVLAAAYELALLAARRTTR